MVWLEQHTDSRAVSLPFLASPIGPLFYLSIYVALIVFGKKYMKNRQPYDLKIILGFYNILQIVFCACILRFAYKGGFNHEFIWKCTEPDTSQSEAAMYMLHGSYYTWLLKGIELIETIFFVMRKKNNQVSRLHVYHHISTFILTWFFARSIAGGMLSFSVVLNSFVHIIMYSYYFIALFGAGVQRKLVWLKQIITRIQMIQFVILLVNGVIASSPGCNSPKWFLSFYMLNLIFLLYMFARFYLRTYFKAKV